MTQLAFGEPGPACLGPRSSRDGTGGVRAVSESGLASWALRAGERLEQAGGFESAISSTDLDLADHARIKQARRG